jgi:hypothetical protein
MSQTRTRARSLRGSGHARLPLANDARPLGHRKIPSPLIVTAAFGGNVLVSAVICRALIYRHRLNCTLTEGYLVFFLPALLGNILFDAVLKRCFPGGLVPIQLGTHHMWEPHSQNLQAYCWSEAFCEADLVDVIQPLRGFRSMDQGLQECSGRRCKRARCIR